MNSNGCSLKRAGFTGRSLAAGLAGFLLAVMWCLGAILEWREYHSVINSSSTLLEQLTVSAYEQTSSLFRQAETSLRVAKHWIEEHPQEYPGDAESFIKLVKQLRKSSGEMLDIRMVTLDGGLQYIPGQRGKKLADVSDRDYFKAQFDEQTRGLFVASPVLSRVTGKWGIPISMPIDTPSSGIALVFAAIELDSVERAFEFERIKPHGTMGIIRNDGIFMFRSPVDLQVIGTSIVGTHSWNEHLAVSPKGTYIAEVSPVDGRKRLVSFARLADYPLIVTVSASLDDVLAEWHLHASLIAVGLLTVTGLCIFLSRGLLEAIRAEEVVRTEMERLMLTDSLTGLGNRRYLMERLGEETVRAHRYGHAFSAIFLDVDHFKLVNDEHGHANGDRVLAAVSRAIKETVRISDTVGRYGGEEFIVLLPETGLNDALLLAERIRNAVSSISVDGVTSRITISAGVACLQQNEGEEALLKRCDDALYRAKNSGRDRTVADHAP